LNKHLSLLISLQGLDTEAAKHKIKKKDLPVRVARLNDVMSKESQVFADNKKKYDELTAQHRELEAKLKRGLDGLNKAKDRLGEVKTNKEYQAILKEIDNGEVRNSEIETEIICLLEEIDQRKQSLDEEEKQKERRTRQYENEKQQILSEMESLDEKNLGCTEQYEKLLENIPKDLIRRYEMIKALNNGTAVVSVWKGVCGGCHMNIPPQLYNELQKSDELLSCPNCSRIIYWQNQEKAMA